MQWKARGPFPASDLSVPSRLFFFFSQFGDIDPQWNTWTKNRLIKKYFAQ